MVQRFVDLVDLFETSCEKYGSRPLYGRRSEGGSWEWTTYGEVASLVERARAGLAAQGVRAGDRVAVISENRLEWVVGAFAAYGLGAAYVPMYRAQKAEDRRYILHDSGAKVVLTADTALASEVEAMDLTLPPRTIAFDAPPDDPRGWSRLLAAGEAAPVPSRPPSPVELADIIYTSGTTGRPKGVLLSHGNIASNVSGVHAVFELEPDDRSLAFLPWAHAYGQTCEVHFLLSMGCSVAINQRLEDLLRDLGEVHPTILIAVPRIFHRLYEVVNRQLAERPRLVQRLVRAGVRAGLRRARGETLSPLERGLHRLCDALVFETVRARLGGRLKYAISASATLSREVADFIDAIGIEVYEGYGLTETSPIVSANFPDRRRRGSVGQAIAGVRVEIDRTIGIGDAQRGEGEVVVHGPNVMIGYHGLPEETRATLTSDGGLRTGDLGYVDEDGYLFITGRIKEQYKLENGKYVMPAPLEEAIKLSPFVANAIVEGAGQAFSSALIVVAEPAVRAWAAENGLAATIGFAELVKDARVKELLEREVTERTTAFAAYARPHQIALLTEDFTVENGLLTPTLKVRRRDVLARYSAVLHGLYEQGRAAASAST